MEAVVSIFALWVLLTVCAAGIASGSVNWKSEDTAYHKDHIQHARALREAPRKEPKPPRTKDSIQPVDKELQKAPVSDDLGNTRLVHGVMVKKVLFCREDQSADEALRIMRTHDVPYLLVLNDNLRIVGTVWMVDLVKQKGNPPESDG
jgi:CBS domain